MGMEGKVRRCRGKEGERKKWSSLSLPCGRRRGAHACGSCRERSLSRVWVPSPLPPPFPILYYHINGRVMRLGGSHLGTVTPQLQTSPPSADGLGGGVSSPVPLAFPLLLCLRLCVMAGDGVIAVAVASPPSPSHSEEEEEIERSQKSKLREMIRLLKFPGGPGEDVGGGEGHGRDALGEGEPEEVKTLVDLSRKLSLSGGGEARGDAALQQRQESESDEEDEVFIVGETGEVALRDYPHSRHLCGKLPFSKTPHESYCDQCYCYVCDIPAPCGQWKESADGHCNATEQDDMWKNLRKAKRSDRQAEVLPTSC